ncbi:4-hydroxy-tetrahydrodipicolinate synthase [Candidatus Pandoraea novymonadis]|uniref:4-hydroxy-tetrahydrodipicolinate synthase n=1 Tax=Candidatus Pandoraea novymonadis TaxID=1808959 RepID=A0ABX5FES8_9BURK|nr:4-hydroxy-tetrahydrodipicolinate synthase [Candidatus Pandoraea novymonadis]PSB92211.1 4-hydroxy-tetrahydrodipicolinate synthase [Candidatus Pandoraea novymonadis]
MATKTPIRGSIVAVVTPMLEDGSIDNASFCNLIDWHIAEGTDAIVIVGTSGESPTVSVEEHFALIKLAVEYTRKRIPIIAGTGGNSTAEAIELTRYAKQVGADASLQVVPYYNKPTQEGIYQHFCKIAESVDLPVILYNVPGRTVADVSNETLLRLAQVPGIVGLKDATGNLENGIRLINTLPDNFALYSGDDQTAVMLMLMGAQGNISVTANVVPRLMHQLCYASMSGDVVHARALQFRLLDLHRAMFIEANPIPVKWALQQMGKISSGIRLPLTPLAAQFHVTVRNALRDIGILL